MNGERSHSMNHAQLTGERGEKACLAATRGAENRRHASWKEGSAHVVQHNLALPTLTTRLVTQTATHPLTFEV